MVAEERLSQDEIALVLRRAAELDESPAGPRADDRLPVAAIEAAASEVGLPAAAVQQAVAELRAGLLTDAGAPGAPAAPAVVVEAAVVPMEPEAALAELGRWLTAQTFHRHRGRDGVEVWRVREDWVAGMQRAFDWSASVRLKGVRQVVVRAVPVEGGTLLRLEATLAGATVVAPALGAAGGSMAGGGVLITGAAVGSLTVAAVGATVTGAGAVGGWIAGRSMRRRSRDKIADELAAELDRIATGLSSVRSPLDRLRARAGRRPGHWV